MVSVVEHTASERHDRRQAIAIQPRRDERFRDNSSDISRPRQTAIDSQLVQIVVVGLRKREAEASRRVLGQVGRVGDDYVVSGRKAFPGIEAAPARSFRLTVEGCPRTAKFKLTQQLN